MIKEASDFRKECDVLTQALEGVADETFTIVTQFKSWTIEDVISHLHMWNHAAALTLQSREAFQEFFAFVLKHLGAGEGHQQLQRAWLKEFHKGISGQSLFDEWKAFYPQIAEQYHNADPNLRVAWAGPDMTTTAKIIARQMETWAHGQEVFDALGLDRSESDRIKNIADLGVRTYGWTFRNRDEEPPHPKPYVCLTAPSGAIWEWNDPQKDNIVRGDAIAFSQIVTQTRNIDDTDLEMVGDNAKAWMKVAQCFAGAPEMPPAKNVRHKMIVS